ncbi:hypothetical protein BVX97_03885 [bacterium E08(2017)]|nr:hypothetical protein BVX97_03885 [bacterium E08(2017)]
MHISESIRSTSLVVAALSVFCVSDALAGGCGGGKSVRIVKGGCRRGKAGKGKCSAQAFSREVTSVGILKKMGDLDDLPEGSEDLKEDDSYHGLSTLKHYKKKSAKQATVKVVINQKKAKKRKK